MQNTEITQNKEQRIRMMDYVVHFNTECSFIEFEVYPIEEWFIYGTKKKGFDYIDKEDEPSTRSKFEKDKCLQKLKGSFGYRGLWKCDISFTDTEYSGSELCELAELYKKHIEPWCKDFIKKRDYSDFFID